MKTALKVAAGLGAISALSGLASTAYAQAPNTSTATASGSATIIQSISISKTADLGFGTIVRPTTATSTIVMSAGGTRSITGGGNAIATTSGGAGTAASFTVLGEGTAAISVNVPVTFNLMNGTNALVVTTTNTGVTGPISGSLGTQGSFIVGVGGSFPLATNTPSGAYSGSLVVSVSYN